MKWKKVLVVSFAATALILALWLVGGNAWAARREEQCDREWTATFGSLEDVKKKYPKHGTNETAKQLETLTRGSAFDLTPVVRAQEPRRHHLDAEWKKKSQGVFDFVSAQIARPEASIELPAGEVVRFLDEKRVTLDAIESILAAGPRPQWSFDLSLSENERPMPNLLGQIRLQRVLLARALTAAQAGHHDAVARSLEASWSLNESLRGRPETMPAILGMAISHLEVGALRKVNVGEHVWQERLATLNPRTALLDALGLDYRPHSARTWWGPVEKSDRDASYFQRARSFLERPSYRLAMADYSGLMRTEFEPLWSVPLLDRFPEFPSGNGGSTAHIIAAISMPNIKNSFVRADRLVLDAELTSKILEAKRLRKENGGRWPAAIPGIGTSRYPDASWRYEVSPEGRMSLAFSRELESPYGTNIKPLPLTFSSN
jgi:hypothetical protein